MIRELKFRVYDCISKKMYQWEDIKHLPLIDFDAEHYILQQFIGIKDMDGVDIYEGDIIGRMGSGINDNDNSNSFLGTVIYEDRGFEAYSEDDENDFDDVLNYIPEIIKIMSNIFS
jgi:hypothetical protein